MIVRLCAESSGQEFSLQWLEAGAMSLFSEFIATADLSGEF